MNWTHRYNYKIETPVNTLNRGKIFTGTIQVAEEMTPSQVHDFVKTMCHLWKNSKLLDCSLIEKRLACNN